MNQKSALIIGIGGQDGSYLAEQLLEDGIRVSGVIRRHSTPEHQTSRISRIEKDIETYYGDLTDASSIHSILNKTQPDVVYNLGAQSHVRISFENPALTLQTNGSGVLSLLESVKNQYPNCRIYQASSSEMFGDTVDSDGFQRESTPMTPVSPYGCAKLLAFNLVRNYRKSYGLFASNGILFNHESPRRGSNFVTSKVIKTAIEIKLGKATELRLGNLDSYRDWGHAKDYVRAMQMIMDLDEPDDYVVATGETRSVRDLCEIVFHSLDLDYRDWVKVDEKFFRPEELPYLKGDSDKFRSKTGWKPLYKFESLVEEMIESWMNHYSTRD